MPCRRPEVDALLPGGGFPRGAIAELSGGPASGKTAVALSLFAALDEEEIAAFVDGRRELYPPAAGALGVDLARLLIVRPAAAASPARRAWAGTRGRQAGAERDPALAALWAAEALLGSGAFGAVAIDVPLARGLRGAGAALRRLQAAAEKGGSVGLWLASPGAGVRPPAAVRVELSSRGGRISARRMMGWSAESYAASASQSPDANPHPYSVSRGRPVGHGQGPTGVGKAFEFGFAFGSPR